MVDYPWAAPAPIEIVTINYLPGYGHLDVYYGTHSREDMKEPMLQWLNDRF